MSNNIFTLQDKVIVITGAAGLLGKMHAEAVASNGGIPILLDISTKGLKDFSDFLKNKYHTDTAFVEVDITDEIAVKNTSDNISENFLKIDGLINNAANNPAMESSVKNFSRLENFPLDQWNNDINVGLTGAFLCSKYFGQKIADNKKAPKGAFLFLMIKAYCLIKPLFISTISCSLRVPTACLSCSCARM